MRRKKETIVSDSHIDMVPKNSKGLTTNTSKINTAMEDIKRFIDGNARPEQKVKKIEDILYSLYI